MSDQILLAVGIIIGLAVLTAFVWSLIWVYEDAGKQGKTALAWLLIVFFTWPLGVAVYALLRRTPVRL